MDDKFESDKNEEAVNTVDSKKICWERLKTYTLANLLIFMLWALVVRFSVEWEPLLLGLTVITAILWWKLSENFSRMLRNSR